MKPPGPSAAHPRRAKRSNLPVQRTFDPHDPFLQAAAAFEIKGYPLPVSIDVCPNAAVAATYLVNVAHSPNLVGPMQNGRLVMYLPMWGDDTADMARKIHSAFSSFHDRT